MLFKIDKVAESLPSGKKAAMAYGGRSGITLVFQPQPAGHYRCT
jgi:hypothetical protein